MRTPAVMACALRLPCGQLQDRAKCFGSSASLFVASRGQPLVEPVIFRAIEQAKLAQYALVGVRVGAFGAQLIGRHVLHQGAPYGW